MAATAAGYDVNKEDTKEAEIVVPLKYLRNFRETLDMPLINCEVSMALTWSENCVITVQGDNPAAQGDNPEVCDDFPKNATFKITDTKLHVPVVTVSAENDNKLLEQLKTGFKRIIKWNIYRSEMSNQARNNNLNYLIDTIFTNVNRLFVLSLENENDRTSSSKYYVTKVEIKDFHLLIDGKPFFEIAVRNKEEAYEAIMEMMSKNNNYATGNLLGYEYFPKHYKLIAINLSKQIELENPDLKQQINFIGRLEEKNATMFFIIEKKEETTFDFFTKFCDCCLICIRMEAQKTVNLLDDSADEFYSEFPTRKSYIINDQNNGQHGEGNENYSTILKQKLLGQIFVITLMHIFL